MGHNHSFVAMSPLPQSRSSVESIEQETRINGTMTTEAPQQSEMSLQEENERLRNQLAATQEQLRLLQAKNNELEPLKNGESTKRRHRKRWNWIQREEHELVPQEESSSLEIISTPRDTAEVTSTSMDSGLHRRHLEHPASPTLEENDTDTPLNTPFAIKAKMSDLELEKMEKGKHSPNRSDASDESFLNEYSIEEECVANIEDESFFRGMIDRSGWLVGLLILQSCSSFILSHNQGLLEEHIVIVQFLTMLVGAGGNAGNQASVRVIRGLAVRSLRNENIKPFLWSEFRMGICLSLILGVVGCIRAAIFMVPLAETLAITASLLMIVVISVAIGATLPLIMHFVNIDPAHSSTTIQVLMDILGVSITCLVSGALLNSSLGKLLSPDLYADSSDGAANSL